MRRARDSIVSMSPGISSRRRGDVGVEPRFGAGALEHLGEEGLDRGRVLDHRPQHVEALDVARALPDRGQRRLAVEARHARLLDVAVAAEALEASTACAGRPLADPVLEHGGGEAAELGGVLVARGDLVVGAGEAHRGDRRRLGLDAEVGEHVAHQRLVDQHLAEGGAVGGVVERLRDPGAVAGGGADHAVEPGVVDHLDDRRHAAALLADHARPGAVELDLAGGVGAVAELVLEPLDVEGVALAVGRPARHQEAGEARSRSGRGRGRRRTSAPSRTTCGR